VSGPAVLAARARRIVAYVHVEDVARSVAFYAKLGFTVKNTFSAVHAEPTWAWLESGGADLMVARSSGPIDAEQQAILFYVYCDDVPAAHAELEASGVTCGPVTYPFYCPKGEFRISDPDGYGITIAHT
jgi:predicted enzyme related to lactoylglutathione lyase